MNVRYRFIMTFILILLVLCGCSGKNDRKTELTISAAASLQNALYDIKKAFEAEHPGIKLNFNFGASGTLQQQITQGAPVDLFFSAAEDKFDKLVEDGLIKKENAADLVGNELVIVVPTGSTKEIHGFEDLAKAEKISIGTPESVPAGAYAKETLETLHVWEILSDKMVYAKDVRQALTYAETGNVDASIVYKTDAIISKKAGIAATAIKNSHSPIIYPAGIIQNSSHPKEAELFFDFLQDDKSIEALEKHGFNRLQ
ncbi:molybdate ABC transporter substrate-binding protein [Peribacillus saganii]|uniref:Molybdate ABC transporter substrate-binding protein n=1 Tax=Peribacillus saganii TaxID=2303992 RepID=A0A372LT84_9BACI|nr:molybdate ABC transporter substrate-binding protein [Peribacillus saganii]RFU71421.1 molybdate ABC transporter substrate-binding protein [Peribacillus saganii]